MKASLGSLFEPAQDPRQVYADPYQRQLALLGYVRQALAEIVRAKGQLDGQTVRLRAKVTTLDGQALSALLAGHDNLARYILRRRHLVLLELEAQAAKIAGVEQEEERLARVEQHLVTQLEEFNLRRETIAARYSAAEAQVRIQDALTGLSWEFDDLGFALDRAEATIGRLQARTAAIDWLVNAEALELPGTPAGGLAEGELAELDVAQAATGHG